MYGKWFAKAYDGSLAGRTYELLLLSYMVACEDAKGHVVCNQLLVAAKLGVTPDIVDKALLALTTPDPHSTDPDEGGRRIKRVAGTPYTWKLINHEKYRGIRTDEDRKKQNKEAAKRYRDKKQGGP